MTKKIVLAGGGAAAALLLLAGCTTPTPEPTATTEPTTSPSATVAPTVEPTSDAIVLPACEDMLDLAVVQTNFGANAQFLDVVADGDLTSLLPGPAAQTALDAAVSREGCLWGIPNSDGAFFVIVADIPLSARDTLVSALGSSDFSETVIGSAPAFVWERDDEMGTLTTVYVFADPIWVTVTGAGTTASQTAIAEDVVMDMRDLFPAIS
ncbi:hypothetical protein GCM10009808_19840 [Microbacterium sediminicola]|uniref:DUF3558 domain-containing protein n=1 Tax=Microbacterium sediminicola TaxID=415210 RepID=A0ABP4UBX3_9MICO